MKPKTINLTNYVHGKHLNLRIDTPGKPFGYISDRQLKRAKSHLCGLVPCDCGLIATALYDGQLYILILNSNGSGQFIPDTTPLEGVI